MRSEKVAINSFWGMAYKFITILLGFAGRTFFIKYLGSEYLGISGLFSNILTMLSLSELGFSTAVTFHLYKVLADDDREAITGIMNFYKFFYRIVAIFIGVSGVLILPFLKYIVGNTKFSLPYVAIVYLIYLFKTVCSYLFSYNFTIASADQKTYLLTKIDIVMHIVISVVNIISLVVFRNYIIFLLVEILLVFLSNILKSRKVLKTYPYITQKTKISPERKKKILKDVGNIFTGKVATVVVTSTDNILISTLINISTVGLYSNYSMIISYVQTFLTQVTHALQAGLGNLLATESKEYAYTTLKRTTLILHFAASFCSVCLFTLLTPFVTIWIGEGYILDSATVFLCVLNFYLQIMKYPLWFSLGGIGYFAQDRNIAIYGAASNLIVSIIAAKCWGLCGIFFGTVFSQITQWFFKAKLFMGSYLKRSMREYLGISGGLMLLTVMMSGMTITAVDVLGISNRVADFVARLIACMILPNAVNFLIFRKSDAFQYLLKLMKNFADRKIFRKRDCDL